MTSSAFQENDEIEEEEEAKEISVEESAKTATEEKIPEEIKGNTETRSR